MPGAVAQPVPAELADLRLVRQFRAATADGQRVLVVKERSVWTPERVREIRDGIARHLARMDAAGLADAAADRKRARLRAVDAELETVLAYLEER